VVDFEDTGCVGGEGVEESVDVGLVYGAVAGPEVLVTLALIVVEVELSDAGAEEFEGGFYAGFGEVGVAEVEGDAHGGEATDAEDLEEVFGGGDFVLDVFEEYLDAEGMCEGLEVLDGGEGVFEGPEVPGLVFGAEVKSDGGEGELLGGLEGALDLVLSGDAAGFFGVDEVEVGGDVAGPLGVGAVGDVDGLVEGGGDVVIAEPVGEVADGGAVGVVEVVAGGEDFDDGGAGGLEDVEQAGVQALREEDVCGDSGLHPKSTLQQCSVDWMEEG